MANAILSKRDESIIASIINPDSMLLGSAFPSAAVLENLTERLKKNKKEFATKSIGKALFYIAQAAHPEQAASAITSIANNKDLDLEVRQDAISALGLLPPEFADGPLAAALKESAGVTESIILKALARAGDKTGLKTLKSLQPSTNASLTKLRAYTETMIALRLGETISAEAERKTLPRITPFKFSEENIETLKKTIDSIEGKPFGLTFNQEFGFSFDCASCKHTILFNTNFKSGAFLKSITQAQIVGIIVMEDQARGRNILRYSILLRPDKNTSRVSILRTTGEVALCGELRSTGDYLTLNLRDLGTGVRPIQVSGTISNDEIKINAETFNSVTKTKLNGIPIN
jgi:hypothetical protein